MRNLPSFDAENVNVGFSAFKSGGIAAEFDAMSCAIMFSRRRRERKWPAHSIESKLTAMGKDERAISVSGYVYRGNVKYTAHAFNKTTVYKRRSRNHLVDQVENFRIGDKENKRENDLLDTFCYGIAIALRNEKGF
jgi:hypothetical protein